MTEDQKMKLAGEWTEVFKTIISDHLMRPNATKPAPISIRVLCVIGDLADGDNVSINIGGGISPKTKAMLEGINVLPLLLDMDGNRQECQEEAKERQ